MKNELETLLQKEMDRKDFLKHVVIGVAAVTGFATVLKTMNTLSGGQAKSPLSYGGAAYGGSKVSE